MSSDRRRAFEMSTEENKELFFRYQDALRSNNPDDLKAVLAPDFVGHDLPPGLPPGPEGLILFRKKANQAFPDQKIEEMEDLIAVDDKVVARFTMTQTHKGEFMGLAATGKTVTIEL